jgi:hypothetical protein
MEIIFSQVPHSFSAQTIAENAFNDEPLEPIDVRNDIKKTKQEL